MLHINIEMTSPARHMSKTKCMSEYDILGKIMKNGILVEGGEIWMFNHLLMVEEILGRKSRFYIYVESRDVIKELAW